MENSDFHYRVVLVGDGGVGKTSLLAKEIEGSHPIDSSSVNAESKMFEHASLNHHITFWDTPGGTIYSKHTMRYCAGAAALMIVYDVTNSDSFVRVEDMVTDIEKVNQTCRIFNIPVIIVANKIDAVPSKPRAISTDQGSKFASMRQFKYFEVSAKTGKGVKELFAGVAAAIATSIKDPLDTVQMMHKNITLGQELIKSRQNDIISKIVFQR